MEVLRAIRRRLVWQAAQRRRRRRWRDAKVLLILVLACVLFQVFGLACGVVGYVLQRLGLLPEDGSSVVDTASDQAYGLDDGRFVVREPRYGIMAMRAGVA